MADDKTASQSEKLLSQAKERFKQCVEAEHKIREAALDDLKFLDGDQWPAQVKNQRQIDGRPCLTINRLPAFVRQVTNSQRQNRVSAKVSPVDDAADVKTAEVIQGLLRNIEYNSNADVAYDTAAFYAAAIGMGFLRLQTDYCYPDSFDQDIRILRIRNPFSVYLDPTAQEPDGSDAEFAFIVTTLTKEEYEEQYPDKPISKGDWESTGDQDASWISDEGIRIAEYFYKDETQDTLYLLEKTTEQGPQQISILKSALPGGKVPEGAKIAKERDTETSVVKWCKLSGQDILEETILPGSGKWIPVVRVLGDELDVNGELHLQGVVRNAKDPQRSYNYWKSAQTEAIALAPKAPVVGAEGQFEGHEKEWQQANVRNFAYLEYKPTTINGVNVPAPQRMTAEPAIQAITEAAREATDDLKATTGIYDASLGSQGNETSGRGILARQQQGDVSNFHYVDNMARGVSQSARIMLDWIPYIYDTARVVRIVGEDDTHKTVMVNQADPQTNAGYEGVFDLKAGRYDVVCSAGPSFATKRQQATEQMAQVAQAYPPIMQIAGDLILKAMDVPYAQEMAERFKKTLPPQLQEQSGQQDIPPEVAQQLQQSQQQLQQLNAYAQQLEAKVKDAESGASIKQAELDARYNIAELQSATQLQIAQLKGEQAGALATLQGEIQAIHNTMDGLRAGQQAQQQHAMAMEQQSAQPEPAQPNS